MALARDQQPVQVWGAESRIADDQAACREYSASPTPLDVQNSCLSQTVSPVKKPQARTAPASALRNHCQVSPSRRGAGGTGGGAERLGSKSPTDRRLASERQGTRKRSRRRRRRLYKKARSIPGHHPRFSSSARSAPDWTLCTPKPAARILAAGGVILAPTFLHPTSQANRGTRHFGAHTPTPPPQIRTPPPRFHGHTRISGLASAVLGHALEGHQISQPGFRPHSWWGPRQDWGLDWGLPDAIALPAARCCVSWAVSARQRRRARGDDGGLHDKTDHC